MNVNILLESEKPFYNKKMHQGLSILVIFAFFCVFFPKAQAQLNRHDEIIEGVQDIDLQDDSQSQSNQENKIQSEEEFQKKQLSPEQQVEDEIKSQEKQDANVTEKQDNEAEPIQQRKEVSEEKSKTYEDELRKNAEKDKKRAEEDTSSNDTGFAVDKQKAKAPAVEDAPDEDSAALEEITAPMANEPNEPHAKEIKKEKMNASDKIEYGKGSPGDEERVYTSEAEEPDIVYETGALKSEKHLSDAEREKLSRETNVDIEPDDDTQIEVVKTATHYLGKYRDRRPPWTTEFELGSSQYEPINYDSAIIDTQSNDQTYKAFYGSPKIPMPSLALDFKKNFSWGAASFGFAASYFQASASGSKLSMIVPTVRAHIYLDALFGEPYVVPYATFGDSYFLYNETGGDDGSGNPLSVSGKSDSFYYGFGILLQLDWLDPSVTDATRAETGLQNTFVFLEGRSYTTSGVVHKPDDPNFSSGLFLATGLKLEF